MAVVLTGGTGLVGNAVLRALLMSGHEVIALVRSDESADQVRALGATAVVGDLTDPDWVRDQFAASDGAIHTASPGDETSKDFDAGIVRAAVGAFSGTDKPYVHTGGVWVHGAGDALDEETPFDAPQLTAWRAEVENEALGADFRVAIIEPGIVYQDADHGLPAVLAHPNEAGEHRLIGDGSQRWTTVSADQLADLYVRAFDNPDASGYYLGVNDDHPTVREIAEAAAGGTEAVVGETREETEARLPAPLVEALLLDQVASNAKARRELGWTPTGPALVEVLAAG